MFFSLLAHPGKPEVMFSDYDTTGYWACAQFILYALKLPDPGSLGPCNGPNSEMIISGNAPILIICLDLHFHDMRTMCNTCDASGVMEGRGGGEGNVQCEVGRPEGGGRGRGGNGKWGVRKKAVSLCTYTQAHHTQTSLVKVAVSSSSLTNGSLF